MNASGSLSTSARNDLARRAHALGGSLADDDAGALTGDAAVALEVDVGTALESDRARRLCGAHRYALPPTCGERRGCEGRIPALLPLAVDVDVDDLVVERDEALQCRGGHDRVLVAPGDVVVAAHAPVRRDALVRAARGACRRLVVGRGPPWGGTSASAGRSRSRPPAARLGQHDAVQRDAHGARARHEVDAVVGVARVDEDLLVLLVPVLDGIPVERHAIGDGGVPAGSRDSPRPCSRRPCRPRGSSSSARRP